MVVLVRGGRPEIRAGHHRPGLAVPMLYQGRGWVFGSRAARPGLDTDRLAGQRADRPGIRRRQRDNTVQLAANRLLGYRNLRPGGAVPMKAERLDRRRAFAVTADRPDIVGGVRRNLFYFIEPRH